MSISVLQAIILGLFAGLINAELFPFGYATSVMMGKPLIIACLAGLIVGDVKTGIIIGVTLQSLYLGAVVIGGVSSLPRIGMTCWYAVPLCIAAVNGGSMGIEDATALCVTICLAGSVIETVLGTVNNVIKQIFLHWSDAAINRGDLKGGYWINWITCIIIFVEAFIIVVLFVVLGQDVVIAVVDALPAWVTGVMSTFTSLLPLLGFMMLMNVMMKNSLQWILFIFGFALIKVAGLDIITVTIIAVTVAYIMFLLQSPKKEEA